MKVRSIILSLFFIMLCLFSLVNCGGGGTTPVDNPFAGTYTGTFTGQDTGTWTATVSVTGAVQATIISDMIGQIDGTGTMTQAGVYNVTGIALGGGQSSTFEGVFDGQTFIGSGTWTSDAGLSGTWSGQRD